MKKEFPFLFIFNWVSSVCTFNITLREPKGKEMESWHLPPSQGLENHFMALFWVLSEVVRLLKRLDPIPYLVKRQDTAVTQTTFVKDMQSGSRVTRNRAELLQSGRELTTKMGEQPWPQLVRYASICCCVCGCVFQEDGIVVRSAGEEWYID